MSRPTREEWLAERRTGIGGSDIAALVGLSKWQTPYDIWLEKRGEAPPDDGGEKPWLYWGAKLEALIAREYRKRTGREIRRIKRMLRHRDHPFACANIDRAVVTDGPIRLRDGRLTTSRLLECKTAGQYAAAEWGEEGTDEIPVYYMTQVQWYLFVTGASTCDVAVLIGGNDFRVYTVERDEAMIDGLIDIAGEFWREHVQTGIAPDPQTVEDARHRWPRSISGQQAIIDVQAASACVELAEIAERVKKLDARKGELQARVMGAMGDAAEAAHGGDVYATWKTQTRKTTDIKALREQYPDIADEFTISSETRVFRLAKAAKELATK